MRDLKDTAIVGVPPPPIDGMDGKRDPARAVRPKSRRGAKEGTGRPGLDPGEPGTRPSRTRNQPVGVAILQRYRRHEGSMEEAVLELYHAGISLRQAEGLAEALWGARVKLTTVGECAERIAARIESWRNQPVVGRHPYVHLGQIDLKRAWGGETMEVTVLAATGINDDGVRDLLGVADAGTAKADAWRGFLAHLRGRGLTGVRLFVAGHDPELADAIAEVYPRAVLQSCVWHFNRRILAEVPFAQLTSVEQMLRSIHASEDRSAAQVQAAQVVGRLHQMGLPGAAARVAAGVPPTLRYYQFPGEHRRALRSSFPLQKLLREVRERTRIVGAFSDPASAVQLVAARLRGAAGRRRGWRHDGDVGFAP